MIQVKNISKAFADQSLFENISFNLSTGEKLGIVGRNGCGKSTLLKIILGQLSPDSGEVAIPKNYKLGYLEQHIHFSQTTVLAEASLGLSPEEQFDHYKVEKILFGLGFNQEDMQRDPTTFSGGQQIRINLAKILVSNAQLLLLDEPTNYLDLPAIRWLIDFLRRFKGEVILITHDRNFMDAVTTHTMIIYRKKIKKVRGNTTKLYEQIAQEDEIHQKTLVNQQRKREQIEEFVRRFKAKATKATLAQSRMKMLEKMEVLDELGQESALNLNFHYFHCPAKVIGEVTNISFNYPNCDPLINNLSFYINRNDRIAIIGKNGKGKSTLLNLLAGELSPVQGEIKYHSLCRIGHFGQTNIDRLHGDHTIEQEIGLENDKLGVAKIRAICGAMLFSGELAEKKIQVLSGGERARVMLGKILAKEVNLLLLDEPTNHLDMQSIEVLSLQLEQFSGAVVFVTHSELLLREVATKLIVFRNGNVELFDGSYDEFLAKVGWEEEDAKEEVVANHKTNELSWKEKKIRRASLVKERNEKLRPLKIKCSECEQTIEQRESELSLKQSELIDASNKQDSAWIESVSMQVAQLEEELEQLIDIYTEVGSKIEEIEFEYNRLIAQYD